MKLGGVRSFDIKLRTRPGQYWDRINLPFTIKTDRIKIKVIEVESIMFSGFWEVRLTGCGPTLEDWQPTDWQNLQLSTTSRPFPVHPTSEPIIVRNKFHLPTYVCEL